MKATLIVHNALELRRESLPLAPTGGPPTTTESPNAHLPLIDPLTTIDLMPPHTKLPDHLVRLIGNLTIAVNTENVRLPGTLVTAIPTEDVLLLETVHPTLILHHVLDLRRHRHHEPHLDDGRPPMWTSPAALHLATGTPACLADHVAVPLIEKTPLAERVMEIAIVIVNQPPNTVVSHQYMDLLIIHLAHHATVLALSDFAAALVHIHIALQLDLTSL